jgi:pilus assembly protein FimV
VAAKINPLKLKQDAEKEEKAGRVERAIVIYRQIVDDNPRDWNTVNKIGDLYVRLNKTKEASAEYAKVADFYAKDGFLLKAIALWKKIDRIDPSALEPKLNLADLYAKQGLMMEAKGQYQVVVDEYIKRNKMRDAGDVLKKMADIDPSDLKIRSKLADLYTRDGNSAKAIEEHIAIAEELNKKGHLAEALQVLEKGLKIDARNVKLRTELARIHLIQKNYDKAGHFLEEAVHLAPQDTQILARLGDAYIGSKKLEEAEAIFKRLLELDPKDDESRVQMGRVFLLQGDYDRSYDELVPIVERALERREGDRAQNLLQQIVQKNPAHVKSLLKLADVYRILQKDSAVLATYSQLVEAYVQQEQYEQAASVLETLVSREPQNGQHRTKLDFVRAKLSGAPAPAPPSSAAAPPPAANVEVEDEEFDLSSPMSEPAPAPTPRAAAPRPPASASPASAAAAHASDAVEVPSIELSGPLSDEDKEFVEEHLAEGKVFRKYGLVDKAADQFESVVARFPDNVEARQELREVYREKSQLAKAAEQSLALAEIFRLRGDAATAETHRADAARFAPEKVPAPAAPPVIEEEEAEEEHEETESVAAEEQEEQEIAFGEDEEEIPFGEGDEEVRLDGDGDLGAAAAPPAAEEESAQFIGDDEPPSFEAPPEAAPAEEEAFDEPAPQEDFAEETFDLGPMPSEPTGEPPSEGGDLFALEEAPEAPSDTSEEWSSEADQVAGPQDAAFDESPFAAEPPPEPEPEPAPEPLAAAAPDAAPPELQRILDEVESYVALGFVDDARASLRDADARFPGHPAIELKVAELGFTFDDEPAAAAPDEELDFGAPPAAHASESAPDFSRHREPEPQAPQEDPLDDLGSLDFSEGAAAEDREPAPSSDDLLGEAGPDGSWAAEQEPAPEPDRQPEPEPAAAAPFEGGMDLGAELSDLFGAQSAVEEPEAETGSTGLDAGLADIFKEFKKGVDKQLGKEDYDTRYNLGIAYKEMGLIDEAIAEFQLAAKDENRMLECSSMLGICFMDKGMPKLAVKWFEKGLAAPNRSEDEYAALRYDLAVAHEAAGDVERALSLFSDLYGQDANFRDVAAKVRELRASQR